MYMYIHVYTYTIRYMVVRYICIVSTMEVTSLTSPRLSTSELEDGRASTVQFFYQKQS